MVGNRSKDTFTTHEVDHNKQYQANMGYLVFYVFSLSIAMLQLGYILAANNQVQSILDVQFGVTDKEEKDLYNSLIGSSAVLGACIGSVFGSVAIKNGRRKAILINNIVCAISVVPTLFLNVYSICIGRFVFGFCGGIYQVLVPRSIEETVPTYKLGAFGIVTNLAVCGGKMLSLVIGAGVPDKTDTEAMKTTNYWRIVFALPLFLVAMQLIIYFFFITEDTIKYSIDTKNDKDALKQIKKVYHGDKNDQDHYDEILQYLKDTGSKASQNKVTLKEALSGANYWRSTWYCFGLVIFNQMCGQNAILLYSSTILEKMQDPSGGGLSPKAGTTLIGVVNFVAAFFAIYPVRYFKRRTLFLGGHLITTICLTLVGIFAFYEVNIGILIMLLATLWVFQCTIGPGTWIYVAEVTSNAGMGFDMLSYKATLLAISLSTSFLMDSALKPQGVFWMFAGFTITGFFYHLILMKETKHLTDKEKKSLYCVHSVETTYDQHKILHLDQDEYNDKNSNSDEKQSKMTESTTGMLPFINHHKDSKV